VLFSTQIIIASAIWSEQSRTWRQPLAQQMPMVNFMLSVRANADPACPLFVGAIRG